MGRTVLRKVVVDVREFMSSLPAVLHQQGLEIIPVTLEAWGFTFFSSFAPTAASRASPKP